MPIPNLTASVVKFLRAVKPLLNEAEYEETEKSASEFLKEGGDHLQNLLIENSKDKENWVIEFGILLNLLLLI